MNEVVMVPTEELNWLSNYYQGKITESALLNKAGRMAAEQQLILEDKSIPDSLAVRMVKPMALEQGRLVKRVRTGTAQPASYEGIEEPEGMVDAPIERLLKDIIKKQTPEVIEVESDAPTKKTSVKKKSLKKLTVKKQPYSPRPEKKPKPSTSGYKTPASSVIPKGLSSAAKQALKDLGWREGNDSPKGGGKGKKKIRKTEAEKLKEGWEPWTKPAKRGPLDYGTGEED